jgi:hypothetical protein
VKESSGAVAALLRLYYSDIERWPRWPKPLHLIQGALLIHSGVDVAEAAKIVGTTAPRLLDIATSPDPVTAVLGVREVDVPADALIRLKRRIGELVRGRAAEIAFEDICKAGIDPQEYSMTDVRESRNSTDFRLLNGAKRPLFRLNVKFFGALFRRSAEMVGLAPSDCFPLATYKIFAALQQQEREHLAYVFAIVGVPGLDANAVAEIIPESEVRPVATLAASKSVSRKRDFEDWLVTRIVQAREPAFATAYGKIRNSKWYVLSARRAIRLMHELLFGRVYALSVPGFTRKFGGAEVDMHFSFSQDMVSLDEFLVALREEGHGKVTHMLADGVW